MGVSRWSAATLAALLVVGCSVSPGHPTYYPVKGRVLYEGNPIPEAQVTLHPLGQSLPMKPLGNTDAQGWFALTTFGTNDGAPAGHYVVTVQWKQLVQTGEEKTRSGRNQLPAHYGDEKRSKLRCEIEEGQNELLVFQLKR